MQRTIWLVSVAVLAGLLAVWLLAFSQPYSFHGSVIEPPIPAPPIELNRADGTMYRLSDRQGKIILIFFGYTTCPDFCPATMAEMKRVKADLAAFADRLDVVFITVDPQRDTPERIHAYATGFDPQFIGLSGSEEELSPIWKAYGVYRQIQEGQSALGYLVDHSTRVYLIDPSGNLRLTFSYGTPPQDIAADIRQILKEK